MDWKHCTDYMLFAVNIKNTKCGLDTYQNTFQPENRNFLTQWASAPKKGVFIKEIVISVAEIFLQEYTLFFINTPFFGAEAHCV